MNSRYVVSGDSSPKTETKVYIEQVFVCRNRKCTDHGKEIGTIKNPIQLSKEA